MNVTEILQAREKEILGQMVGYDALVAELSQVRAALMAVNSTLPGNTRIVIRPYGMRSGAQKHRILDIVRRFPEGCTGREIYAILKREGEEVSLNAIFSRTSDMRRDGIMRSVYRGVYAVANQPNGAAS